MLYKKRDVQDIGNDRPICLLSVVYKLFTRVTLNRITRTLDEGQPCEQAGFLRGFSTIDHIHTIAKLIEVSREFKLPLCLTKHNATIREESFTKAEYGRGPMLSTEEEAQIKTLKDAEVGGRQISIQLKRSRNPIGTLLKNPVQ
ncbi:unnamed protein product [Heligmosomoides polygyrus]|uniref:Tc3 transposase DNA binding domain-containing protein n=1 Tax=Heligmosomoides polygyrus TaxID=6339 RepID=A0A3P8E6K1_HELPZ|nr:unnamed protein product [Heligmosomoides polygyrus]